MIGLVPTALTREVEREPLTSAVAVGGLLTLGAAFTDPHAPTQVLANIVSPLGHGITPALEHAHTWLTGQPVTWVFTVLLVVGGVLSYVKAVRAAARLPFQLAEIRYSEPPRVQWRLGSAGWSSVRPAIER
ncbi:hypothetical protein E9529_18100 [Blastococcus sp. KM273128]|uniref:hypothetical protein n=1 Tax=Blastococcus sp. KM273128 TaxID=2570314 RepID=UPI001F39C215|nr:hypothetical protein [Blastococcus sp. KM273128]MCF6746149.1 hypothetical protein [Blastococcus sp. KM273128]